ncbi:MAG: hypothetical protein L6Q97_24125, partial [Thermoanaerobaculia bacterium]|nr:hypothetical protein [Thermoanaerobaculia bacterium]
MKSLLTLLLVLPTILPATSSHPFPVSRKAACDIDLGPDVTVCKNATFALNPHAAPLGDYTWT